MERRGLIAAAVATAVATLLAFSAWGEEPAEVYIKLGKLRGKKYAQARDPFLKDPATPKFLAERVSKNPEDWLAVALLARTGEALHAREFDKVANLFAGARAGVQVGDDFDERAFWIYPRDVLPKDLLPLRDPLANSIPNRHPTDGIDSTVPKFDWMVELALELEWAVMNPEDLQANHRAGVFFRRLDLELGPGVLGKGPPLWLEELEQSDRPYDRKSLHSFDASRFQRWLAALRDGDYEGFVQATAAVAAPGPESNRTLQTLSREDSFLGAFAALMYSARLNPPGRKPPFDAEWLEAWIRRARGNQLRAAEELFLGRDRGLNPATLRVPPIVVGLFLEHSAGERSPKLKQIYAQAVEESLQNFLNVANDLKPDTDPDSFVMHQLRRSFPASPLWPNSAADKLANVQGTNSKILEYVKKAKARVGEREYPRADDLQAMFAPPKK